MGCCKCIVEYLGTDLQPAVYADPADGKEYCVFHAPKDEKRKRLGSAERHTVDEFNALVFARIDAVKAKVDAGDKDAECDLSRTVFPGDISFWQYGADNPLPKIIFSQATFIGAAGFAWATFSGPARFPEATFSGAAVFIRATFSGLVLFFGAAFRDAAEFNGATFSGKADFRNAKTTTDGSVQMLDMEASSLKHLTFTRVELPLFTFRNRRWPKRLGLETHGLGDADNLLECEELYRAMKQRADDDHDRPQVSHWHYREKLMGLKSIIRDKAALEVLDAVDGREYCLRCRALLWVLLVMMLRLRAWFSLTWWYWVSSGFGERPKRAMVVLSFMLLATFGIMLTVGLKAGSGVVSFVPDTWSRILAALHHLVFITNPVASPSEAMSWSMVVLLTRVLIPIQFGLFALAVRNRFRR